MRQTSEIRSPKAENDGPETRQLHIRRLASSLPTGIVIGILAVLSQVSYGVLLFTGDLSGFVSQGIGLVLFGAVVFSAILALTSSFSGTIALSQGGPAAILGVLATIMANRMPASATPETVYYTVVAAVMLTSLITGMFFLLMGYFKLGNLVRFVPYPVIGGFLAGVGWLVIKGAINSMTERSLKFSNVPLFLQVQILIKWLPGVIFGIVLLLILRRYKHFLIMPALFLTAIGLFYLTLRLTGTSVAEAGSQGWFLGPFSSGSLWKPLTLSSFSQVDWMVLLKHIGNAAPILLISLISFLLNATGLELVIQKDFDLNRELQLVGAANVAAGLGGGPVGYHVLGQSTLAYRMGDSSRFVGLCVTGVCGATLFFGASLLSYFPKPVLGGSLVFIGLSFLVEWVYDARQKLPKIDYLLVLLILVVIGVFGFLQGVGVGLLVAGGLFILNYSRMTVVRNELSGANYHSNFDRSEHHRQTLRQKGEQITILKLHGFIFFGTANTLLERIRQRIHDSDHLPLRYLVLDFHHVRGLDSSVMYSFIKMKQLAKNHDFVLVLTYLSQEIRHQLEEAEILEDDTTLCRAFPDLDHSLEWCEDQVLLAENLSLLEEKQPLQQQLEHIFPHPAIAAKLMRYLEKCVKAPGTYLMRYGDPADDLYFIESGVVTIQIDLEEGKVLRLRTRGAGTTIGEVGLFLGGMRSASVVIERHGTFYRLTADALKRMQADDPDVLVELHVFIIRLLAERLADSSRIIKTMVD